MSDEKVLVNGIRENCFYYKTAYLAMVTRACFFPPTYGPIHVCDQSIRKGDGLEL